MTPVISGDEDIHRFACEVNGGEWVECTNRPVGRKHNKTTIRAQQLGADYVFVMGSDDFICPRLAEWYPPLMKAGVEYAGIKGCFFWETASDRVGLFEGYPKGHRNHLKSLGTARLIHKSLLAKRDWMPWDPSLNAGLDSSLERRLYHPKAVTRQIGLDAICLDVKTGWNIWSYDHLVKHYPGIAESTFTPDDVLSQFPEDLSTLRGLALGRIGEA